MVEKNPAASASKEKEHLVDAAPVLREEHAESSFTRGLEQQAAKIPSHWFLAASLASMVGAATLEILGRRHSSRFVGIWAQSLLVMGVYNKLVKTLGPR